MSYLFIVKDALLSEMDLAAQHLAFSIGKNALVHNFERQLTPAHPFDLLVGVGNWKYAYKLLKTKKRVWWTGSAPTSPSSFGIGDKRVMQDIDYAFFVTEWQRQAVCQASRFPLERSFLLCPGVHLSHFRVSIERLKHRLIHVSDHLEGMDTLATAFWQLKQKYPLLSLHLYGASYAERLRFFSKLPDVAVHGPLYPHLLAQELMRSYIFLYPAPTLDACPDALLQAQAAGCALLTTVQGGLPEIVGDAGICTDTHFTESLDQLLSDDTLLAQFSQNALKQAQGYDWSVRAHEFLVLAKKLTG